MAVALLALPLPAMADGVRVPTGQPVSLMEVIWPDGSAPGERAARFRFLAPKVKRDEGNEKDMMALCEEVALPAIREKGVTVDQIIVSLSARPVKFGEPHPEVIQVIEAFVIEDGKCAVEGL